MKNTMSADLFAEINFHHPARKKFRVEQTVTFEEEGGSQDVVKVQGKDSDTPGYLTGDRVRLRRRRSLIVGASPFARSR